MERGESLEPHQKDALRKLKNGSILWGGVGTGKSRVAMAYYVERESPKNIYVITTAKKRDSADWLGEAAVFSIGTQEDETKHGILTVDSWNNLHKYDKVHGAFFIFDEQRVIGSGKWVKAFLKITRKNRWILLSATPGDTWMDYVPVFVANGFYKNRTEFKSRHVVYAPYTKYPKILRYTDVNSLVKHRNDVLVRMRYARETVRHSQMVYTDYDVDLMETVTKRRWNPFKDEPIRDAGELFALMRRIANSHPSRAEAIRQIMKDHPRLIIFYNFNYELEILREFKADIEVAEWNGHKHENLPNCQDWLYLVQYAAGSEGWNCIETDAMCFYSLTPSYKRWEQSFGRIERMNTPFTDLYYYILRSKHTVDMAIYRSLRAKKDFNYATFDWRVLDWN
jgi:superfamily II DNA or RNA helicase